MKRKITAALMLAACLSFGAGITAIAHPADCQRTQYGCHDGYRHHGEERRAGCGHHRRRSCEERHHAEDCPYCLGEHPEDCPYWN